MSVYLGKQRNLANTYVTFTRGTLLELVWKVEGVGHYILWTITLAHRSFSIIYATGKSTMWYSSVTIGRRCHRI
jgi:hypothetical protein